MSQRIASYTTTDEARQRFARNNRITPSCQLVPATNTIALADAAPAQASPPSSCFLWCERSVSAPTIGRRTAEISVVSVMTYSESDPGAIGMPRTDRSVAHLRASELTNPQAACSATVVRYGLNKTVSVVV